MSEEQRYFRVIDANLNRSREGFRVIEDTARFVLDDTDLYKEIRALRHRLDTLTRDIYPQLLRERESQDDAGRALPEGPREGLEAVLSANFRRAQEALRVLEEYSRLVIPSAGPSFKEIRYATYQLEKKINCLK